MTEMFQNETALLLLRVSLMLLFGAAVISLVRKQTPSMAIAIARLLLVAMWIGPLLILSGWSLPLPILPNNVDVAENVAVPSKPTTIENNLPAAIEEAAFEESAFGEGTGNRLAQPDADQNFIADPTRGLPTSKETVRDSSVGSFYLAKPAESATAGLETAGLERAESRTMTTGTSGASLMSFAKLFLAAIWLTVTTFLLIRFVVRVIQTACVIRRSGHSDEGLNVVLLRVAKRLEIDRIPSLRTSSEISGPCTIGWWKPILLFPTSWLEEKSDLTNQQIEMILAHELTHARSHDAVWDALGQFTLAFWWFHPLVAIITRQHRLACEHRCDAAASQIAGDIESYRRQLARWVLAIRDAQDTHLAHHRSLVSLSMARRSLILKRLSWLKNGQLVERNSIRKRLSVLIGVTSVGLLCVLIHPAQRADAAAQNDVSEAEPKEALEIPDAGSAAPQDDAIVAYKRKFAYSSGVKYGLDWEDLVTVSCTVMNENGEPISDAWIELTGLSDQKGESGSFLLDGGTPADDRGNIKIKLPKGTGSFRLEVKAKNYVTFSERIELAEKVTVQMKTGRVVRIRATNENNELLPDAFPFFADGRTFNREFEKQTDGTHVSPLLPPDRRWMWVVDGSSESGPILFSDLIDLADNMIVDEEGFVHPQLRIGTRLEGVLGDEVPRPIKNGFVHVYVKSGENPQKGSLEWHEHTRIESNGSFVFESLPRDAHAQVFAICEGWQSTSPSRESVDEYSKKHDALSEKRIANTFNRVESKPQLYHLDSLKSPVQISVPCRQSSGLDVRVVDSSGQPLVGATVAMSPNLAFFGNLVIPGWKMYSNELVRNNGEINLEVVVAPNREPVVFPELNSFAQFANHSYLEVKTDATGMARVRNLPNLHESFKVEAKGFVMSAFPTSSPENPKRYGLTGDLTPGKIKKMTITMERELNPISRELMVVDQDGKPLKDMTLTITSIASDFEDPDWQQWSVRRFGAPGKGKTDAEGNVRLLFPKKIAEGAVALLAVKVSGMVGQLGNQSSVNKTLVIPAQPNGINSSNDSGDLSGWGIRVTWNDLTEEERSRDRYPVADAKYVDILSGNGSPKQNLQMLLERTDLLSLRKLLAANKYDALTPLKLKGDMNQTALSRMGGVMVNGVRQYGVAIEKVETQSGDRIVAMASVRPKGATWTTKPERSFPPNAVFIFDQAGTLMHVFGGETPLAGKRNARLVNLGGTSDFFVRVTGDKPQSPYDRITHWFHIDEPEKPALTFCHRDSFGTAIPDGSNFPIAECGFLGFKDKAGKNESGLLVPHSLVWDKPTGKFYGELSQTYDGKPGYQVVVEESAKFEAVSTKPGEVTVAGGRGSFGNWHSWRVVVPEGEVLTAKLELRDVDGKTLRLIQEDQLNPGRNHLQLAFNEAKLGKEAKANAIESSKKTLLRTQIKTAGSPKDLRNDIKKFEIPHFTVDESPTLKNHTSYFATKPPLRIIEKQSTDKSQTLVWIVE